MSGLAVPSQRTWTVSDLETAALFNSNIRDAVNYLINPPSFLVGITTAPSIANNAETTIVWDTVIDDNYSGFSTVTGIYTVPTSGRWLLNTWGIWANNATGTRAIHLVANGAGGWNWQLATTDGRGRCAVDGTARLTAGQTISVGGFQTSGGALAFGATVTSSNAGFSGVWIGT